MGRLAYCGRGHPPPPSCLRELHIFTFAIWQIVDTPEGDLISTLPTNLDRTPSYTRRDSPNFGRGQAPIALCQLTGFRHLADRGHSGGRPDLGAPPGLHQPRRDPAAPRQVPVSGQAWLGPRGLAGAGPPAHQQADRGRRPPLTTGLTGADRQPLQAVGGAGPSTYLDDASARCIIFGDMMYFNRQCAAASDGLWCVVVRCVGREASDRSVHVSQFSLRQRRT
jgi:hypothetical protein